MDTTPAVVTASLIATARPFEARQYLGMSAIGQCPRYLFSVVTTGQPKPTPRQRLLFHEGYLHEDDVVARLEAAGFPVTDRDREIVAPWDERHRGHIDGYIESARLLLEIKSCNAARFYQARKAPLLGHYDQVQVYMHYADYRPRRCLIVYKNREDGDLWTHIVHYDPPEAAALEQKARRILAAVDRKWPPDCECGRCHV